MTTLSSTAESDIHPAQILVLANWLKIENSENKDIAFTVYKELTSAGIHTTSCADHLTDCVLTQLILAQSVNQQLSKYMSVFSIKHIEEELFKRMLPSTNAKS